MNRHKMNLFKASYVDYKNGRDYDDRRQDISTDYGDNAGDQTKGYVGNEQVDATAFQESMKNLDFTEANQEVANTEGMEHRITVQTHKVAGDNFHSLIKITPENQELYKNDTRFKKGKDGQLYMTLGAGPNAIGNLESDINRPNDFNQENKYAESLPLNVPTEIEDQKIKELIKLDSNYRDNLDYDLFPERPENQKWHKPDDGYNSNSYVPGLLNSVGIEAPNLNQEINLPGYDKPVPSEKFKDSSSEKKSGQTN